MMHCSFISCWFVKKTTKNMSGVDTEYICGTEAGSVSGISCAYICFSVVGCD